MSLIFHGYPLSCPFICLYGFISLQYVHHHPALPYFSRTIAYKNISLKKNSIGIISLLLLSCALICQNMEFIMSTHWNTTPILNLQQVVIKYSDEIIVNYFVIILFASSIYRWTLVTIFAPFTKTTVILLPQNKFGRDYLVPLPMIKIDINVYLLVWLVFVVVLLFFVSSSISSSTFLLPYTTKECDYFQTW